MTPYLISFDDGTMPFPDEGLPEVAAASRAVVRKAQDAGVRVHGAGVEHESWSVVGPDGTATESPYPARKAVVGGFSILDVPSHEEALRRAAKMAVACRCAREARADGRPGGLTPRAAPIMAACTSTRASPGRPRRTPSWPC